MASDDTTESHGDGGIDWDETALDLLREVDGRLSELERDADGTKQRAVAEGRELLDDLADVLDDASDDGFDSYQEDDGWTPKRP